MKSCLLLLGMLIGFTAWNQHQSVSNAAEWNTLLQLSRQFERTGEIPRDALERFPVCTIHGHSFVSLYGIPQPSVSWQAFRDAGVLIGSRTGAVATMKVPLELVHRLDFSSVYSYVEIPAKAYPHLNKALVDTHADSVQHGWGLPEAFTGEDVLIGITDWGFDYTHPMFYDTLLQASRIHAAWDQYKQAGDLPAGYAYGVEYDTPSELQTAGSDTANIYSYHTHGTHVAGIAGGSGAGTAYRGFAFGSQFLFATFLIDAASVIDAFHWMKAKADASGKRLVINMSWGLYYMGTLDGNSLLSQVMDDLSGQGVVFVTSAGNNGNVNFHIKKVFGNDAFSSQIHFYDYGANANMWGQSITMWGEQGQDFSAGISVYNSSGTLLAASPLYGTAMNGYLDTLLVSGNDTIFFNVAAEPANPLNNRPNMRLRVKNTNTSLKIVLNSTAAAGTVHYWNVTELTTGVGNWGMPFTAYGAGGLSGDSQFSIGEPACSPDAISVAAYLSGYFSANGTPLGGGIASFTSTGPLYTEDMKPDIAAPGVSVGSSISSFTDAAYSNIQTVTFNGTDYDFARFSGTSMASPCVAGIAALMLDANPDLSAAQVKQIIKTTARTDNHTGAITDPGHTRWGMGKINAYQAVVAALNTVSTDELETGSWLVVYPNPASESVQVFTPDNLSPDRITLISTDGKRIPVALEGNAFDCSPLPAGVYVVEGIYHGKPVRTRFLKI